MMRLYSTTDPIEAEVIRLLLREKGIEPALDNEGGDAYAIGFPTSAVPLGISVSDKDAGEAAGTLARDFEKKDMASGSDPHALLPPGPGESAEFERKVRQERPHSGVPWTLIFLLPNAVAPLYFSLRGELDIGVLLALILLGILGIARGMHALVGVGVKMKGPAP